MEKDELTLRLGRRGAALVFRRLRCSGGPLAPKDERRYISSLLKQIQSFLDTRPPLAGGWEVIEVGGVPAREYYGEEEERQEPRTA